MSRLMRRNAERGDGCRAVDLAGQAEYAVFRIIMVGQLAAYGFNADILTAVAVQNPSGNPVICVEEGTLLHFEYAADTRNCAYSAISAPIKTIQYVGS